MPEPQQLPTEEELLRLSLRALVAYAARCARRAQPSFTSQHKQHVEAVDRAIILAEQFAGAANASEAADYAKVGEAADEAADGDSALAAAVAAAAAARTARSTPYATRAACTATFAGDAADEADAAVPGAIAASRLDYQRLLDLSTEPAPALGEPIDFDALGPLWPEREPESLKWTGKLKGPQPTAEPRPQGRIGISAYVGEFAPEEEVADALVKFCRALNAHHIACGGNGLVIDDWEILAPEPEPTEVL